jgi:hypothetical protein
MEDQRIDLVHTLLAQSGRGPCNVGMVANLGAGIGLAPNEHPRHDILGHVRFHVACVELLHQHQHDQGHVQGHIPRQARAAIGVFACPSPVTRHDLAKCLPWKSAFELKQRVVVIHVD